MASRKQAHALDLAQHICYTHDDDPDVFTFEEVQEWSEQDLYDWIEAWGYTWEGVDGWVDLEDIDYPDGSPLPFAREPEPFEENLSTKRPQEPELKPSKVNDCPF